MLFTIATVVGLVAVAMFVLSYQMRSRNNIIILNAGSRILYVIQYIILGAFEGAMLDIVAFIASVVCHNQYKKIIREHLKLTIVLTNLFIVGMGMLTYKNIFSLLPIIGVILEISALWFGKISYLRVMSLIAIPFWMTYNIMSSAYSSVAGNIITAVSITIALIRYDIPNRKKLKEETSGQEG